MRYEKFYLYLRLAYISLRKHNIKYKERTTHNKHTHTHACMQEILII